MLIVDLSPFIGVQLLLELKQLLIKTNLFSVTAEHQLSAVAGQGSLNQKLNSL